MSGELSRILDSFDSVKIHSLSSLVGFDTKSSFEDELVNQIVKGNLKHCKIDGEYVLNEKKHSSESDHLVTTTIAGLSMSANSSKEIQNVFRFCRQLMKAKQSPSHAPPAASRYTNFTLQHAWEKFDCQTQILQREALVPLMKNNPQLLDLDVDLQYGTNNPQNIITYTDLKRPSGEIVA